MPNLKLFGHRLPVFGAHFAGQNYRKTKENLFRRKVCRCHYPKKPYISSSGGIRHKPSPRRPRRPWGEGSALILSSFPATREARATATTFAPAPPISTIWMNSYAWNSSLFTAFLPSARVMFTAPAPPTPTGTSASLFASSSYVVSTLEKKAFWSHLKRQQVRAFPYQSPWTNLLGTKGILRMYFISQAPTIILICWKQLLRLPRLFVLLQSCLPICNWLNRTYGRAGRLCLRPECYPRSNSRTKLKSLLIPAHLC